MFQKWPLINLVAFYRERFRSSVKNVRFFLLRILVNRAITPPYATAYVVIKPILISIFYWVHTDSFLIFRLIFGLL